MSYQKKMIKDETDFLLKKINTIFPNYFVEFIHFSFYFKSKLIFRSTIIMTLLFHKLRWGYIRNNFQSFFFTIIYIAITLSLFIYRFGQYADTTIALAIARASAIAIYWQSGLIIVLILRKSISYVRSFGLARYFPLDHYVYFHKVTGWSIAFFSLVHTLAHLYNFAKLTNITTISYIDFLVSVNLGIGWFFGSACLTGWILVIILVIMLIFSMNFIRRTGNFEVCFTIHFILIKSF